MSWNILNEQNFNDFQANRITFKVLLLLPNARTGLICTEQYVRVNFCNGGSVVLLQINKNYHAVKGSPYSEEHVDEGVTFLIQLIKTMRRAKPKWSKLQHLKGKNVRLKKMLVSL